VNREQSIIIINSIVNNETNMYTVEEVIGLIYDGFDKQLCINCKHKRDTDINGNSMSGEIFCIKTARCENETFGCNRWSGE